MPFQLFALTNDPASRIVRFVLSDDVQLELTTFLQSQEQRFNNYAATEIQFNGKYKPDDGEVLVIDNYDDIDGITQVIGTPLGVPEVQPSAMAFETIKALFTGYINSNDETVVLIQHFDKRKIISPNGISIFHAANVYKKIEGIGITVDSKLSAILKENSLRFLSFHVVRQIFDLSEYYLEATDSDIDEFASLPVIKAADLPKLIGMSDTWIRRKFSLIQQSQILEKVPMNEIKAVALEFNIPLRTVIENDLELIVLPDNKADLKTILRFLDEDYYKSPLSKTQCVTNSKRLV